MLLPPDGLRLPRAGLDEPVVEPWLLPFFCEPMGDGPERCSLPLDERVVDEPGVRETEPRTLTSGPER